MSIGRIQARLYLFKLVVIAILLTVTSVGYSSNLFGLFGIGGDDGTNNVAHREFKLDDGFYVSSVLWSPDGKYIATSGSQSRTVHVWDVKSRSIAHSLELPNPPTPKFHNMAWSRDGRYLAVCNSFESSLRIYNAQNWQVAKDFDRGDAGACQQPVFSDDGAELTIWGSDLTTFSTSDWQLIRRLKGESSFGDKNAWDSNKGPQAIAYIPHSHSLAIGGRQFERPDTLSYPCAYQPSAITGRVWILESQETKFNHSIQVYCTPAGGTVNQIAFGPDGLEFATTTTSQVRKEKTDKYGYLTDSVRVMRLKDGEQLAAPLDYIASGIPRAISYTADSHYLLVGNGGMSEASLFIIDARTNKLADEVHSPHGVTDIAVSPDSSMFASATGNGVIVWKFNAN